MSVMLPLVDAPSVAVYACREEAEKKKLEDRVVHDYSNDPPPAGADDDDDDDDDGDKGKGKDGKGRPKSRASSRGSAK